MSMIHVAGGTYTEICHFPHWHELYGSAGRAAAALAGLSDGVVLSTFSSKPGIAARKALADCFGFQLGTVADNAPEVAFEYLHPLRASSVQPERDRISGRKIHVAAPTVLRFGCWEGEVIVDANIAVYDPQSPGSPDRFDANGSRADRLAIVCNMEEGRLLTGKREPASIVTALATEHGAEVVVLKCGPAGALVKSTGGDFHSVPSYQVDRIFPIGSGDVFSAVFAHYWAEIGNAAEIAADKASKAAAWYCSTSTFPRGRDWEQKSPIEWRPAPRPSADQVPRVYLAGPFFSVQQLWFVEEICSELEGMGMAVFSPYHDVGSPPSSREIAERDLAGLRGCNAVLAILDGLDPGTVFEVGYARSIGIPVIGLLQQRASDDLKMFEGTDVALESDIATAIYKAVWAATDQAR